jgi:hypothetical protein
MNDVQPIRLENETRTHVDTKTAAYHMNRRPQTLRAWSCRGDGPIKPVNVHGRLLWPVNEIRKLMAG